MCITDNPLSNCGDRKILTLLYSQADTTCYMRICKTNNDQSSKSTWEHLCHTWFMLTLLGNWGDHLCCLIGFIQRKTNLLSLWQEVILQLGTRSHEVRLLHSCAYLEDSPSQPSERTNPADAWIWNFYSPELWGDTFLLFKSLGFWTLLR